MSGGARAAELLVATRNAGKLVELRAIFAARGYRLVTLADRGIAETPAEDAIECFDTFEENARAKARYFHGMSGMPTIADDSGLMVRALGGMPGVRSRRWAEAPGLGGHALDAANNAKLAVAMDGVSDRVAAFVCAAAYAAEGREVARVGAVDGWIAASARGAGGFGYDAWFVAAELDRTFAEATLEEKGRVSHRARAFGELASAIAAGGS